jgi:hypothetical protein
MEAVVWAWGPCDLVCHIFYDNKHLKTVQLGLLDKFFSKIQNILATWLITRLDMKFGITDYPILNIINLSPESYVFT